MREIECLVGTYLVSDRRMNMLLLVLLLFLLLNHFINKKFSIFFTSTFSTFALSHLYVLLLLLLLFCYYYYYFVNVGVQNSSSLLVSHAIPYYRKESLRDGLEMLIPNGFYEALRNHWFQCPLFSPQLKVH
jgi:hypothetical protein